MSQIKGRQRHNPWQYAFFAFGILFFFLILFNLPRLSIPLMVSYVLYLVFLPLVPKLQRIGIPSLIGRLLIVLTLLFALIYPITYKQQYTRSWRLKKSSTQILRIFSGSMTLLCGHEVHHMSCLHKKSQPLKSKKLVKPKKQKK